MAAERNSRAWQAGALAAALLLGLAAAWYATQAPRSGRGPEAVELAYVGSGACAACHAAESQAWQASQHSVAMQPATPETVLGDFGDATHDYHGVTTTFFRRDGRPWVRTDGPDGRPAEYAVAFTFGVEPLQQYLLALPQGRLQALSVAWDTRPRDAGGQRWFHLYPDEPVDHRDELHWTRTAQNWNYMCADCHSTNVRKRYDAAVDSYDTRYSEISVGCEACHGPGSRHVAWARAPDDEPTRGLTVRFDERRGAGWTRDPRTGRPVRTVARTTEREIEACAPCHARRAQLYDGYAAGDAFGDYYLPTLLTSPLYHVDGQQRDEVFVWASWQQSRMHAAGVTCSDCHDPHTQRLRAPGNDVCAQCHDAVQYDATAHHRHAAGSAGSLCADCHMPRATYMVVDPRRDHSLRVPRPDETVRYGVPNACNQCHADRTPEWAAAAVRGWYGRDARGHQSFAAAFHGADRRDPAAAPRLVAIAFDGSSPPIVRASALERLAGSRDAGASARRAVQDHEWLVRLVAPRLAESLPTEARVAAIGPLLSDPRRSVRIEAARVLAGATLAAPEADAWARAAAEYEATLAYNADRPESHVARGAHLARLGRVDDAGAAFATALRLEPAYEPAYVNGADVLRAAGREAAALEWLESGVARVPGSAALHHALGLAQVRVGRIDQALASLQRATRIQPDNPRYAYVHAVALHSTGRPDAARRELVQALRRWPQDRDMLLALAAFERDAGDRASARRTVSRLLEAYPDDAEVRRLAGQLD